MNKKVLVSSIAALLISSTAHATVAVFLDPVQYKAKFNSSNPPQLGLVGWSSITESTLLGVQANNPIAHQSAENQLQQVHAHADGHYLAPGFYDGSTFEACRNYQLEQLGYALNESRSPLKKYLKDYTQTFGGKIQLATEVQLNVWSPVSLNTQGMASPQLDIVEDGGDGVGLNFTPVVEMYNPLNGKTPQTTCKILSAEEITQIAASQLAVLKQKHMKKMEIRPDFKYKDLVGEISAALQTVPKFGYPAHMDLQMETYTSAGIKWDDMTPQNNPENQPATVAGKAN